MKRFKLCMFSPWQWYWKNTYSCFCKRILHVKKCTPSYMVYNELGRLPLQIVRKIKIVRYWL